MSEVQGYSKDTEIALMQKDLEENTKDTKEILKILRGDGNDGLVTTVALQKQSLNRVWWWLGGISMTMITGALYIIVRGQ